MKKLNLFLKKSVFLFLLSVFFSSVCFSEKYFQVSETELNQIQAETSSLMNSVETLTESVKKAEEQRNKYMTLSSELRQENEKLQAKVKTYKYITLGVCSGAIISGLTVFIMRK